MQIQAPEFFKNHFPTSHHPQPKPTQAHHV
jgi:hypothetical protein